jgi:hypothetical protein
MDAKAKADGAATGRAIVNRLAKVLTNRRFLIVVFGIIGYLAGRSSVVCP